MSANRLSYYWDHDLLLEHRNRWKILESDDEKKAHYTILHEYDLVRCNSCKQKHRPQRFDLSFSLVLPTWLFLSRVLYLRQFATALLTVALASCTSAAENLCSIIPSGPGCSTLITVSTSCSNCLFPVQEQISA